MEHKKTNLFGIELQRWTESLDKAVIEMEKKLYTEFKGARLNEENLSKEVVSLKKTAILAKIIIAKFFELMPKIFEDVNGRKRWERYISSLAAVANSIKNSIFIQYALPLIKLEDAGKKILSWTKETSNVYNELYDVLKTAQSYIDAYQKGEKIMRSFSQEPDDERLTLYSSCKTWNHEKRLEEFYSKLANGMDKSFTIIIEGPIQLFLAITKDHITIIWKILLVENFSNLNNDTKNDILLKDLLLLSDDVRKFAMFLLNDNYLLDLLRLTAKTARKSWYEDEKKRRLSQPTAERKERFVESFEEGLLFKRQGD